MKIRVHRRFYTIAYDGRGRYRILDSDGITMFHLGPKDLARKGNHQRRPVQEVAREHIVQVIQ